MTVTVYVPTGTVKVASPAMMEAVASSGPVRVTSPTWTLFPVGLSTTTLTKDSPSGVGWSQPTKARAKTSVRPATRVGPSKRFITLDVKWMGVAPGHAHLSGNPPAAGRPGASLFSTLPENAVGFDDLSGRPPSDGRRGR